jgi:hypothetical protein
MITYNTFIQRFKDFADNHYFIRSFSHGAPEDVDLEKFNEYPLMHVIYTGASYEDTTKTLSFEVYIFDLPSHYENKQDRQKEVVSDAEQCAEDVIADIVNGGNIFVHEEDYTVQTARVTPLQEESSNVLAGVLLEVDIQIPYERDACNAPIDGVSPEGGEIVYARRGVLRVRTLDSGTDVLSVRTIVVPNGSLTDDGGGQVTLDFTSVTSLSELDDVNLDEPLDREALVYDEATQSWINGGPAKIDIPVYNASASVTITRGMVVAFLGTVSGDRIGVVAFSALSANDPRTLVGVAYETINPRAQGHVRSYGTIYLLNTLAYPLGTILYASTTAGELTATPPSAPDHRIAIGVVTRQHVNTGRIFVRTYTPAYRISDLSDVNTASVTSGEALVFDGSKWRASKVLIPASGTPPPGGWPPNVIYQSSTGELTNEDAFSYNESTNTLAVENITGTTVTGTGVVKGSNTFGQRYATQAATNRALADTASLTVERYFTVTAEGNGESFNIQSNTPSAGNKIVRKIWYKDEAFEATDVDTWTLLHTFADDTAYASTATKWQEYLDGQTYGTPPFTLALSWEDIPALAGIIDGYTADLEVAFAPALLDINYTGNCIRVRRASDNTEQDIGFDGADLDTAAITTFCTGTDCFIKTWYDQSGNGNDGTQSTTASQPKIYDSSTGVLLDNAVPALTFDGTDDHLTFPLTHANNTFYTVFMVRKSSDGTAVSLSSATSATLWADISETSNSNVLSNNFATDGAAFGIFYKNGVQAFSSSTTRTQYKAAMYDGNQILLTILGNGTQTSTTSTSMFLGRYQASGYSYAGTVQCLLVYQSATANKSTDRAAIETALNDYFNVY